MPLARSASFPDMPPSDPAGPPGATPAPALAARPLAPLPAAMAYAARVRWVPFLLAAGISIALSFDAPEGRKRFHFDWDLSRAALEYSLFKEPHIGAAALVGMVAVVAVRRSRWWLAILLTVLVGLGWELGQTTVVGHYARLSDLLPDTIGAVIGVIWGSLVVWLGERMSKE